MLVLVRFFCVVRMLMPVRLGIFSMFMLMIVGMLVGMTVLDVAVPVLMVVHVSVLVFVCHGASARKYITGELKSAAKDVGSGAIENLRDERFQPTCFQLRFH